MTVFSTLPCTTRNTNSKTFLNITNAIGVHLPKRSLNGQGVQKMIDSGGHCQSGAEPQYCELLSDDDKASHIQLKRNFVMGSVRRGSRPNTTDRFDGILERSAFELNATMETIGVDSSCVGSVGWTMASEVFN
jgi:hypothetical protein